MEIVKAKAQHIDAIAQMEREIFRDPWSEQSIRALILSELSFSFVAIREGEIVGYFLGSCIVPEGEVFRLAVKAELRRRGIGYRLLSRVCDLSRESGLEMLFLEVRAQNTPARALYRSLGFVEDMTRRGYYKNPPDDAVLMHLELTKGSLHEHLGI